MRKTKVARGNPFLTWFVQKLPFALFYMTWLLKVHFRAMILPMCYKSFRKKIQCTTVPRRVIWEMTSNDSIVPPSRIPVVGYYSRLYIHIVPIQIRSILTQPSTSTQESVRRIQSHGLITNMTPHDSEHASKAPHTRYKKANIKPECANNLRSQHHHHPSIRPIDNYGVGKISIATFLILLPIIGNLSYNNTAQRRHIPRLVAVFPQIAISTFRKLRSQEIKQHQNQNLRHRPTDIAILQHRPSDLVILQPIHPPTNQAAPNRSCSSTNTKQQS